MKAVGVVRKLDSLGRYVLPKELRSRLNIDIGYSLEVFVDGNSILLRKYEQYCIFCNEVKYVNYYKGKNLCSRCMRELKA